MARKKKKPASGKKRSRKKKNEDSGNEDSGNEAAGEVATPAVPDPPADEPSLVELDADEQAEPTAVDLDADEADDEVPVIDLDADEPPIVDLDDDGAEDELVAALIAEAVATAPTDEEADEPEPPVIDLDAELEAGAPADAATADDAEHGPPTPAVREVEVTGGASADSTEARPAAPPGELTPEEAIRQLIDLGPISSPEIRDRLLAEALAHAEHKDARYRVPFSETPTVGRWKALAGLVILFVAGLVALAPPGWATPEPPAQLGAEERARSLRVALLLQAEQVEAFRVREQRLPATLDEVAEALPGVRYVRSGTRAYQLIAYLPDGSAVVYDSASPMQALEGLEPGWRPGEGAR